MGSGIPDSPLVREGVCLPRRVWSRGIVKGDFGDRDLSLAFYVSVVGEDDRLHPYVKLPALVAVAQDWQLLSPAPPGLHLLLPSLCSTTGFPSSLKMEKEGFRLRWVGPRGNGQQVWP